MALLHSRLVRYTLVRGASVDWYPYPFVDADRHGYGGVFLNSLFLLVGMIVAAAAFVWIGNRRVNRPSEAVAA